MKRIQTILFSFSILCVLQSQEAFSQTLGTVGPHGFRFGFVRVKIQSQAKVKLVAGNIESLFGIKTIAIQYNRDSMAVCEYDTEASYLEHRCEKKDSAEALAIRERWFSIHKDVCEPIFEDYFNRNAEKIGILGVNTNDGRLPILLVRVRMEEPHHHTIGWTTHPFVIMECYFFDSSGRNLAVFELSAVGSPNGDNKDRLRDCYAIAGKLLSKELVKRFEN